MKPFQDTILLSLKKYKQYTVKKKVAKKPRDGCEPMGFVRFPKNDSFWGWLTACILKPWDRRLLLNISHPP